MEKVAQTISQLKVSFTSSFFNLCLINIVWTLVIGVWITYYDKNHNELVCHTNSGVSVLPQHCWVSLYNLEPAMDNGTTVATETNTWMIIYPVIFGQSLGLIVPFLLWFIYDRHYLVKPCQEFKEDAENLVQFFINNFRGHGRYISIFHILEMLHLLVVATIVSLKCYYFKLGPVDFLSVLMGDEASILDRIFPDNAICTVTKNSFRPDLPDVHHYKCLLHLNWLRRTIFMMNSLWLAFLMCCGLLQLLKTLALVMIVPLRLFRLKQQVGRLGCKEQLCHVVAQLDYADYVVIVGLGGRLATRTFNDFIEALYTRFEGSDDGDQGESDGSTIQMSLLNQSGDSENRNLASMQQCDD